MSNIENAIMNGFDYAMDDVKDTFDNISDYIDIEDDDISSEEMAFIACDNLLEEYTDDDLVGYGKLAITIKLVKDIVMRNLQMARDEVLEDVE